MKRIKQLIKRMTSTAGEQEFISWEDYQDKVDFMDMVLWQQQTRRQTITNTL